MNILSYIQRGIQLYNEATDIASRATNAVKDVRTDLSSPDLKTAQQQLAEARDRAHNAHDDLEAAINDRLNS